jgi:serine/threonine protein kinase
VKCGTPFSSALIDETDTTLSCKIPWPISCTDHARTSSLVRGAENEQGIFEEVLHGRLDFDAEPWPSVSEGAKDLVRRMLIRDPRKRLTAHEVLREFPNLITISHIASQFLPVFFPLKLLFVILF